MAHLEVISNAVENIAFRLAEQRGGTITPAELLPYLPVSLELIAEILNDVVAESTAISVETKNGILHYTFTSAQSSQPTDSSLRVTHCVCCDEDVRIGVDDILCGDCAATVERALKTESETNGWPASAVYQHEVCYLAARIPSPVSAEKLASRSRFTVRRMRRKLELLAQGSFVRKEAGAEQYSFPPAPYPRERYLKNIKTIRSLPASITEDIEVRVVHILIALGILFLVLLGFAFWGFPFPLLLTSFFFTAPILAVVIWKRRSKLDSMEVE